MATTLCLCWLTASPIFAQENAENDPLVGDKQLSEWKRLLSDKDPAVRSHAASDFSRIGTSNEDLPRLVEELWNQNEHVRNRAAYRLAKIGPDAVPVLCIAIQDRLGIVRSAASLALERIGEPAELPLIETLGETRSLARASVARTLRNIGPSAKAVPALIQALNEDEYSYARSAAAQALGRVGPEAKPAVPDLIEALQDDKEEVRMSAIGALGSIGPDAQTALSPLKELLKNSNPRVGKAAAEAVRKIEQP
ncbi:MAG: HEAT repeat domain-containing protein [Planctomycetota bacterium]|nr:HEAT repeat domain-containing protein [Planctomycetota bacterium]